MLRPKADELISKEAMVKQIFLFCLLIVKVCGVLFADRHENERPNIFFAIADDWGWPHASSYGDEVIKTPTFDRIAANGVLFTNAYVSAPTCTASRNAILTGQHFWRLKSGSALFGHYPEGFPSYVQALKEAGYFVGSYRKGFGPGSDGGKEVAGKRFRSLEEFLKQRPKDQPFCFWFGTSDPHRPFILDSGVSAGMKPEDVEVPPFFPDVDPVRRDILDYYWEVERFDRQVGEALGLLETQGLSDNTIVVITGDHGFPFPRGKASLYDHGARVPLAIKWHAQTPKSRVVTDFVSLTDLAPTFLEATGVGILPGTTGRSLLPILRSAKEGRVTSDREYVLTGKERHTLAQLDHRGGTPMRAIRTDLFLYIHNFKPERWPSGHPDGSVYGPAYSEVNEGPTKSYIIEHKDEPDMEVYWQLSFGLRPADELYDLRMDPYQMNNVAERTEYMDTLKRLKEKLFNELERYEDPRIIGGADAFDQYEYLGRILGKQ